VIKWNGGIIHITMHELSVTQSILEISLAHAREANAQKIIRLNLVIGEFASVLDDSVQFYWDHISKDTLAEGSILVFDRIPAIFECQACKSHLQWSEIGSTCPHCQSPNLKIIRGTEFYLDSIDVEEDAVSAKPD